MRKILPLALAFSVVAISGIASAAGIESFTKPSDDRWSAFIRPGIIGEVLVKDGDLVQEGQCLVKQRDVVSQTEPSLAQLKAEAENDVKIRAAEEDLNKKRSQLQRYENVSAQSTSIEEREQVALDVKIAELTLELSKFQHSQDQLRYQEAERRMQICSPISGRVEMVVPKAGESINALDKVVRVVQLDPLIVEAAVPLQEVRAWALTPGKAARVEFPPANGLVGEATMISGNITNIQSVADPGSRTLLVRVQVPNKELRQAGEHVRVHFDGDGQIDKTASAGSAGQTAMHQGEK